MMNSRQVRAASLLPAYVKPESVALTLHAIAAYAAQRPGLEFGNYCSGWSDASGRAAYTAESRRISRDLARVREALHDAHYAGVTDADVVHACARAFSGRLQVSASGTVDYCTGQYWPTEYRAACVAVLREAERVALRRQER